MSRSNTPRDATESSDNSTGPSANRRDVLKASAVGAAGLAIGSGAIGTGAAANIPLPPLARCGNKLKDPQGNDVILRGVNIADPGRQQRTWRGQTADETVELALNQNEPAPSDVQVDADGWYNNVLRIPTQPQDIHAGSSNTGPSSMPHNDDWGPALPGETQSHGPMTTDHLKDYFTSLIDPLVDAAEEQGAYVMIDYHRHMPWFHQVQHDSWAQWKCGSNTFPDDVGGCGERGVLWHGADQVDTIESEAPQVYQESSDVSPAIENRAEQLNAELNMYWKYVASKYADRNHVLFDIYNEPTGPYAGDWGSPTRMPHTGTDPGSADQDTLVTDEVNRTWWDLWLDRAQPWIDTVAENAPGSVATIGTPRWSQYTYWASEEEFDQNGLQLAYTGHVYTHSTLRPLSEFYGPAADAVPVFFSEFGWAEGGGLDEFTFLEGLTSDYAPGFEDFFDEYPVQVVSWCFDHTWEPFFFKHGQNPTGSAAPQKEAGETWNDYLTDYEVRPGQWWMAYAQEKYESGEGHPEDGSSRFQCENPPTEPPDDTTEPPTEPPGDCGGPTAPELSDGTTPYDTDGDGFHEDFNANCRLDSDDVVQFFERKEDSGVANNPGYYDLNNNDRVDFDDVVKMFGMI